MSAVLQSPPNAAPLTVTLHLDEAATARMRESSGLVGVAEACEVNCSDMALVAKGNLDNVIAFRKRLEADKKDYVSPAKAIIAKAESVYDPHIEAAVKAEGIYRTRLSSWNQIEADRVKREQQEREAEERRLRQEAARKAAEARAKAEAEERAARDRAAEAKRLREQAEADAAAARAAGDREALAQAERTARAASAEQAKQEEKATAAVENGEATAQRIQLTAAATAPATQVVAAAKVGGSRENWEVELDPAKAMDEEAALLLICKAVVMQERTDLIALMNFDMPAAKKLAASLKKNFNVPGYRTENRPIFVNRK